MVALNSPPIPPRKRASNQRQSLPAPSLHEIFYDICMVFNKEPSEITAGVRTNELFFLRCIFCYVSNVLTNEDGGNISAILYKNHTSYINTMRTCNCLFCSNNTIFMRKWEYYVEKSKIWNRYFIYHLPKKTA